MRDDTAIRNRIARSHRTGALDRLSSDNLRAIVSASATVYDDRLDRGRVQELSGRHPDAITDSVAGTVDWLSDIDYYLRNVFGGTDYDRQPRPYTRHDQAHLHRTARGPTVAVLPRNDRGDLAPWVMAQCLLAKSPVAVRPSSHEAGAYVAETYAESLEAAAEAVLDDPVPVADSVHVSPVDDDDLLQRLTALLPDGAQLVLFGADETLDRVRDGLAAADTELAHVVRMGTGTSASVLLDVPDDDIRRCCRHVAESAVFDRGDDCTCTSVLYVHEDRYGAVMDAMEAVRDDLEAGEDFAHSPEHRLDAADSLARRHAATAELRSDALNIIELRHSEPVHEYPVPAVQVKAVAGVDDLVERMQADMDPHNLVTAIFTEDPDAVEDAVHGRLPSTLVRYNVPTHHIDLLQPHQGTELVRELMQGTVVELNETV